MPIEVLMPALSPTMTEGTLANWLKAEGDEVTSGDVIAEIETDKATMEVEAVDEGILGKILVPAGTEGVAVNTPIAVMLGDGEDATLLDGYAPGAAPAPAPAAAAEAPTPTSAPQAAPTAQPSAAPAAGRVFASPLARRLAKEKGLDLSLIQGSGPHGRIVKADIEAAIAAGTGKAAPAAAAPAPVKAEAPAAAAPRPAPAAGMDARAYADALGMSYQAVKNSTARKTVARRLAESKQTVPHFYLTVECEIDRLLQLRKDLNQRAGDISVSVNDWIIKAVARTLRKVPECNSSWTDDAILLYDRVDVSVAVATDGGLITPIIRDADTKGLATIATEMKDLAARARQGELKPEEYQGGGFTISNLGMFGVQHFGAIINPPQSCILAVGAGEQRPIVKDGALGVATVMSCTLAVDHRSVDGAVGAQFLKAFKRIVEDPLTMML